jgi:hypothetical protein
MTKERKKVLYDRKITIRLKAYEYWYLNRQFKKTTCQKLSEYARKLLLAKPVTVTYRNTSADSFLQEMVGLRNELSSIAVNYDQAVKRLHSLSSISEIKAWLLLGEYNQQKFLKKSEEIRGKMHQIYELWLQK